MNRFPFVNSLTGRLTIVGLLAVSAFTLAMLNASRGWSYEAPRKRKPGMEYKVNKTDAEWKKQLTPAQYQVTRHKGTEQAYTGEYAHSKEPGVYQCVCCGHPLFDSKTKFESGTGWPSFWMPLESGVRTQSDRTHGMVRTEVKCDNCGAHLGHVFDDGPAPTGLRYCMNSVALKLEKPKP